MSAAGGHEPPPAVRAARLDAERASGRLVDRLSTSRAYPPPVPARDGETLAVQLAATRALLTAATPREVVAIVMTFVHDLGGRLVPARLASPAALPIDLSLGMSEPVLPWAKRMSPDAVRLAALVPPFVEDARLVCDRLRADRRKMLEADRDPLTGLLSRRAWMRLLADASSGAVVALLDLDRFKQVNDSAGHAAGDAVLRAFGEVLRECFRDEDECGRYGGDELACLVTSMSTGDLAARLDLLREQWVASRPAVAAEVGVSAGVADIRESGGRAALQAADAALYRAKREGRDRTRVADDGEYPTA